MLTWVPASLVISDRWKVRCPTACSQQVSSVTPEKTATSHHHNPTFTRASHHLVNTTPHRASHLVNTTPPGASHLVNTTPPAVSSSQPSNNNSPSIIPLDTSHAACFSSRHFSPPTTPPNSPHNQSSSHSPHSHPSSHSTSQSPPRSPHIPITIPSSPVKPTSGLCFFDAVHQAKDTCCNLVNSFFDRFLPWIIIKPRVLWVILLFGIAVYAAILVLYYPGLRLPDSADFQLFNRDHYFERYDLDHKYNFWFERNLRSDVVNRLPIRIVWGFKPVDNGDHLNPASESTLEFDPTFDMSATDSQSWLLQFCRNLRKQDFYMSTLGPLLPNCFIETFKSWMEERRCADSSQNRYPCCEVMPFPYPRWVFDKCIKEAVDVLYQTPRLYFVPGVAGPKFNKTSGKVAALVVEYDSTSIWSLSYDTMHKFFTQVIV